MKAYNKIHNYMLRKEQKERHTVLFNSLKKLLAIYIRLSLEPSSYGFFLLKRDSKRLNVNTQIHNLSVPFSLTWRKSSSARFGHSLLEIVASKSLSNRSEHTWHEKEASRHEGKVRKAFRASKTGHPVAESHRRFLGVDSLLIHHETKRNYFTRARKRDGLAGAVVRALSRRHFAGAQFGLAASKSANPLRDFEATRIVLAQKRER